jgi:hypothetical protein
MLLVALNDISKGRLEKVPLNKFKFGGGYYNYIQSPFKLLYLDDRLYKPMLSTIGLQRFFNLRTFFTIHTIEYPYVSIYLDHKIADQVSTYKTPLMYGPIVPSNYDYEVYYRRTKSKTIMSDLITKEEQEKLYEDFLHVTPTFFTGDKYASGNMLDYSHNNLLFETLLQKLRESDIIEVEKTQIEFRPFINSCNENAIIIDNTHDDAIKQFDYLLFMVPTECMEASILTEETGDVCPSIEGDNLMQLNAILDEKSIDKNEAVRISNKINNISCPDSWYKKGEYKMDC